MPRHVRDLHAEGRTAMVQPYLASVDRRGETALLHVDGAFSHAIGKGPLLARGAAPTDRLFAEETITPRTPTPEERAVAEAVLAAVPADLGAPLYARVDLVEADDGPVLLELELVEPSMFLRHDPGAADRLAVAALE
jgi:glutathione synthase/RimK-type ligase-like ATP-grasp enzyme